MYASLLLHRVKEKTLKSKKTNINVGLHSDQKCLPRVACLWSKMPIFKRAGMREGGEVLPLAFQYLILMIWRHCDLNLVMISFLASKCQDFKFEMPVFQPFYDMKLKTSNFKVLAFCSQWKYNDQIQVTRSSYQILKCLWERLSTVSTPFLSIFTGYKMLRLWN